MIHVFDGSVWLQVEGRWPGDEIRIGETCGCLWVLCRGSEGMVPVLF